jgi:general secretion pathway protein E
MLFKNGQRLHGVKIIMQTKEFVSVELAEGISRFPISAVHSIDGVAMEVAPVIVMELENSPTVVSSLSTEPPGVVEVALAPPATPTPLPTPAAGMAADAPDRLHFELFLVGFLVVAGLWMWGLREVQRGLFDRGVESRYWTMAALLLPVVGAGGYFVTRSAQDRVSGARAANDSQPSSLPGGSGTAPTRPTGTPNKSLGEKQERPRKGLTYLDGDWRSITKGVPGELSSGLDNASEILEDALLENASDIHIEPASDLYRVRFRLDGILHERMSFVPPDGLKLVSALKSLAEIDVSEKRKAQDGKFRVKCDGREVDFRVATANSIYGEKMVIRVLDHRGGIMDLGSLGMSEEMLAQLQRIINSRNGMILATGPTGSGKTSTLYAALRQLDGASLNIMTIEDPVEYELAGATQIAVNPRAGVTYEGGLRSILRQDPDVILVGEMRDAEATSIALRAALTGHLVFSTLHTKDAIGTVSRLQDLGIERYQVASALLVVLAQRLVRVLCPECRRPYPANGDELEEVGLTFDPGATIYAPGGCEACHGTGFRGRTGIFEMLVLDDEFRAAFSEGRDEAGLTALAVGRGFRNYRHDGAEKVLMGITTAEEVLRAS